MHRALEQKEAKGLHVEDGWIYFIHGWTQVIQKCSISTYSPVKFDEVSKMHKPQGQA